MTSRELAVGFVMGALALGATAKLALHLAPEHAVLLAGGVGRAAGTAKAVSGLKEEAREASKVAPVGPRPGLSRVPTSPLPRLEPSGSSLEEIEAHAAAAVRMTTDIGLTAADFNDFRVTGLKNGEDLKEVVSIVQERASKARSEPVVYRCTVKICPGIQGPSTLTGECRGSSVTVGGGSLSFSFEAHGRSASVSFGSDGIGFSHGRSLTRYASLERHVEPEFGRSYTVESCELRVIGDLAALSALRE